MQKTFLEQFRSPVSLAALTLAFGWLSSAALAADNNAVGTWKASFTTPDGQTIESTLKIKQDGDKLSGMVVGRNGNEYPMDEVKLTGDQFSLKLTRERNGEKVTTKVAAKLAGDILKGKLESNYGGENRTADWEAKRVTETATATASSASADATGAWKYAITLEGGNVLDLVLNLKQEGEKVTGKVSVGDLEAPITEGKVAGDAISFKIPVDRDGNKFTSKYSGTLAGDKIKGKISSDFGGEDHNYDWNASREKAVVSSTANSSANATGTWKWVLVTPDGDSIDLSLKLKQEGDKLTGVVIMGDNEKEISEGLIKDNEVTLKVTREQDGKTQVSNFKGKLEGETIKGKIDSDWSGEQRTYAWNASREKAAACAAGSWKWVLVTPDGDSIDLSLKFKQEGDKLSGVVIMGDNETPILDGLIKDNEVTLKVTREQDGKTQVSKFKGILEGDSIKGKIDSDWSGEQRTYDWNAKRSS